MDLDDLHIECEDEKGVDPLSVVYSPSENPALLSEAGSGDEADDTPDSVVKQVPLPHKLPPSGPGLVGIADSLARDGVLSNETRLEVRRLVDMGRQLNAAVVLLRDWSVADKLGKRIKKRTSGADSRPEKVSRAYAVHLPAGHTQSLVPGRTARGDIIFNGWFCEWVPNCPRRYTG